MNDIQQRKKPERKVSLVFFSIRENAFEKLMRSVSLFCIIFSSVIFIDYFLPRSWSGETIKDWYFLVDDAKMDKGKYRVLEKVEGMTILVQIVTEKHQISVDAKQVDYNHMNVGDPVIIETTKIFHTVTYARAPNRSWKYYPYMNTYGFMLFLPVSLFLLSLLTVLRKVSEDWRQTVFVLQLLLLGGFVFMRLFY